MEALMNNSTFGMSPDSIVVKEIVTIISSAMEGRTSLKDCIRDRIGKLWKIALLLGIPIIMKNMDKVGKVLSRIFFIVFYRRMELDISTVGVDFTLSTLLEAFLPTSATDEKYVWGVPIFTQKTSKLLVIDYCPLFHSSFLTKKREEAKAKYDESLKSKIVSINCIETKREPMELYGSKNFKKAASIIREFFRVLQCKKSFNSQAILIHGERGLGKTCFLDYVAQEKLAETVIYINLTKTAYLSLDFKACVDKIYAITVKGTCVIHIDEIDKHLDYRIKTKYNDLKYEKEKPIASPTEVQVKKDSDQIQVKKERKIPSLREFIETEKVSFLYDLLNLIETDRFPNGVVFILTCNNFETLFSGIDMTHFHSLKRRFLNVTFEKCDLEDFKGYCHFYNESFREKYPEKYIPSGEMEELFLGLDENLRVPFWRIHQGICGSSFCIRSLVQIFTTYNEEEIISFSPSLLLKDNSFSEIEKEEEKEEENKEESKEESKEEGKKNISDFFDSEVDSEDDGKRWELCEDCGYDYEITDDGDENCPTCEKYNKEIPYSSFIKYKGWDAIKKIFPSRNKPCEKTVLSEIQHFSLPEDFVSVLNDDIVEFADRLVSHDIDNADGTNYSDFALNILRCFLPAVEFTFGKPLENKKRIKIYLMLNLYEYMLGELGSRVVFDPKLTKFRNAVLKKGEELCKEEIMLKNEKFREMCAEIKRRTINLDGELNE